MTLGVRAIVLDEAGRVLLVRHTYTEGWHFPGGGVEIGETVHQTLVKELAEEAGVMLTAPPVLHGICFNQAMGRRDHVAVFVVRAFTWGGPPPPNAEIAQADFFALDRLPEGVTASTRARLLELADGRSAGAFW